MCNRLVLDGLIAGKLDHTTESGAKQDTGPSGYEWESPSRMAV